MGGEALAVKAALGPNMARGREEPGAQKCCPHANHPVVVILGGGEPPGASKEGLAATCPLNTWLHAGDSAPVHRSGPPFLHPTLSFCILASLSASWPPCCFPVSFPSSRLMNHPGAQLTPPRAQSGSRGPRRPTVAVLSCEPLPSSPLHPVLQPCLKAFSLPEGSILHGTFHFCPVRSQSTLRAPPSISPCPGAFSVPSE